MFCATGLQGWLSHTATAATPVLVVSGGQEAGSTPQYLTIGPHVDRVYHLRGCGKIQRLHVRDTAGAAAAAAAFTQFGRVLEGAA